MYLFQDRDNALQQNPEPKSLNHRRGVQWADAGCHGGDRGGAARDHQVTSSSSLLLLQE